jgi:hypothetical protein
MSLKYEPASETLHISAPRVSPATSRLFLNPTPEQQEIEREDDVLERRGDGFKYFTDFCLQAKARIWP